MRIISGSHKGRKIIAPAKLPVRPTTDRAKEALFNILYHRLRFSQLTVLDLFSGTGNMSYEFASRGCPSITSIDLNSSCIRFIELTAEKLNFDAILAIQSDYKRYIQSCPQLFDLIFSDPPYQLAELNLIPDLVFENEILHPDGLLVLEHGKANNFEDHPFFLGHRKYGNVHFSFFGNELRS